MTSPTRKQGSIEVLAIGLASFLHGPPLGVSDSQEKQFLQRARKYKLIQNGRKDSQVCFENRHPRRRRSAFFYYYGLNPGRLDFAKVHYGGPYETEAYPPLVLKRQGLS